MEKMKELEKNELETIYGGIGSNSDNGEGIGDVVRDKVPYSER